MQRIERFVVLMYSKGCGAAGMNEATLRLFTSGTKSTKSLESIPPTQAALFQHVKRAILQSSFYWHQALSVQQEIPDFSGWGWQKDALPSANAKADVLTTRAGMTLIASDFVNTSTTLNDPKQ